MDEGAMPAVLCFALMHDQGVCVFAAAVARLRCIWMRLETGLVKLPRVP